MLKSKLVMTYFMFVLLRPRRNDREQFQRKEGCFMIFKQFLSRSHSSKLYRLTQQDVYYIQCVYYLVLIRWPWRKGLSNSLSLSSPKLYCLASGLQNTIIGHCFFEVATGFFHIYNFKKKICGFLVVLQNKVQVF